MDRPTLSPADTATAIDAIRRMEELMRVLDDLEHCGEDCQLRRRVLKMATEEMREVLSRFGA